MRICAARKTLACASLRGQRKTLGAAFSPKLPKSPASPVCSSGLPCRLTRARATSPAEATDKFWVSSLTQSVKVGVVFARLLVATYNQAVYTFKTRLRHGPGNQPPGHYDCRAPLPLKKAPQKLALDFFGAKSPAPGVDDCAPVLHKAWHSSRRSAEDKPALLPKVSLGSLRGLVTRPHPVGLDNSPLPLPASTRQRASSTALALHWAFWNWGCGKEGKCGPEFLRPTKPIESAEPGTPSNRHSTRVESQGALQSRRTWKRRLRHKRASKAFGVLHKAQASQACRLQKGAASQTPALEGFSATRLECALEKYVSFPGKLPCRRVEPRGVWAQPTRPSRPAGKRGALRRRFHFQRQSRTQLSSGKHRHILE